MKYVFISYDGKNRAPVAARVTKNIAKIKNLNIKARYAGLEELLSKDKEVVYKLLNKADKIFTMEHYITFNLISQYPDLRKKIITLGLIIIIL